MDSINVTLKINQVLEIKKGITVKVLGIKGGRVRLGVIAPDNVSVHRHENWIAIQKAIQGEVNENQS